MTEAAVATTAVSDTFAPARPPPVSARKATSDEVALPPRPRPGWLPTARLALVLVGVGVLHLVVTLVAALPASGWLLLGFDAALVAFLAADAAAMPAPRQVTGSRRRPRVLSLRMPDKMAVTVANRGRSTLRGMLRLPVPRTMEVTSDTARVRIPPDSVAEVTFEIRGTRRGLHSFPPLELRSRTPAGLLVRRYHVCTSDVVPVYPNLKEAKRWELNVRQRRREETGLRSSRVLGIGTEFESLREYRPDDDVRQIDWHATARKGTPISRQYRIERNQVVLLLVDVGRLMAAPIGPFSRLDIALNAATAMAYVCSSLDDRVGLVAFDDDIRVQMRAVRQRPTRILAAMSALEPRRVESDYERAFAVCAGMRRALVLLFTDILEESVSAPLLDATPQLARRHVVVVASVLDPDVHEAATVVPPTPEAAYRQAAARDLLRQRAGVTARLAKLGVDIVEAPAERFSLGLIDTYLRIKARARL